MELCEGQTGCLVPMKSCWNRREECPDTRPSSSIFVETFRSPPSPQPSQLTHFKNEFILKTIKEWTEQEKEVSCNVCDTLTLSG